jgi:hypothetical protein
MNRCSLCFAAREPCLVRDGPGARQILDPTIEVSVLQLVDPVALLKKLAQ